MCECLMTIGKLSAERVILVITGTKQEAVFLKNGWHRIKFALRVEKRVTRWSDTYVSVVGELIGREDREAGVWLGDGFELEE